MTANIVRNMPEAEYHAAKALSAGGAWTLIQECPAQFWHGSPWNPDCPVENKREFDIGTAAHLAILEPGRLAERIVEIDARDYRTTAAKELRAAAWENDLVPLLPQDRALVDKLAQAIAMDPWASALFDGGSSEVSFFWNAHGTPCKARADYITADGAVIVDIKTATSANPRAFQKAAFDRGHFLRAPWYLDGYELVAGPARRDYWFVVVAKDPPHLVTTCRLDPRAIEWGRIMIRRAIDLFAECHGKGDWPPYCAEPATLTLPSWAEFQLADREQAGEFEPRSRRPSKTMAERSMEFLAP